jgi:hypothetical protein
LRSGVPAAARDIARAYPWSWMLHSDARDGAVKKPDAETIQKLLEKNC